MFAFALWDAARRRLWLVRDRLGIKPLYYCWDEGRLLFASELKAILKDPGVKREIDPEALELYLTLNYIPAPWTIFRNIRKLPPATYLVAEKGGISLETFWDVDPAPGAGSSLPPEERRRNVFLLEASVKRRLWRTCPWGAFLSGGIDSSIMSPSWPEFVPSGPDLFHRIPRPPPSTRPIMQGRWPGSAGPIITSSLGHRDI
jgi:asparagine synthase (glutamine-hydrolysing)